MLPVLMWFIQEHSFPKAHQGVDLKYVMKYLYSDFKPFLFRGYNKYLINELPL